MKPDSQDRLNLNRETGKERKILDQIREDQELIERLNITPQELEALSKCALMGTLTCKQDMLFILRQIREAGADHTTLVLQPAAPEERRENPGLDFPRILVDIAHATLHGPASHEGVVRRRVLFGTLVLVVGLVVWNGMNWMSRWCENFFMTTIGSPAAPPSGAWYSHLDGPNVLLLGEILVVAGVAVVVHRRARRSSASKVDRSGRHRGSSGQWDRRI